MTLDFYVRKNTTNNAKKQLFDSTNLRIMFLKFARIPKRPYTRLYYIAFSLIQYSLRHYTILHLAEPHFCTDMVYTFIIILLTSVLP